MDIEIAKRIYVLLRDQGYDKANGMFYFEMVMKYAVCDKFFCDMAIWFPNYKQLVGIELKDWAKPVPPSVIQDHYQAYSRVFDYFYIAAPNFSKKTLEQLIDTNIGVIVMDDPYWIDSPPRLNRVYSSDHADFRRRLDNNWNKHNKRLMETYGDVFLPGEPEPQQRLP